MKKRSLLAGICLLAVLNGTFSSCAETKESSDSSSVTDVNETEPVVEAVEEEETIPDSGLPEMDFGGANYRISCCGQSDADVLYVEELTGEVLNDEIYERNVLVEDTYNFNIVAENTCSGDYTAHTAVMKTLCAAGDDAYELVSGHVVGTCNSAIEGYFLNLYDVEYLNFSAPWWAPQSVEQMTVYGKMFTINSAIEYRELAGADVLFFNKELMNQFGMELPYERVREGTWTMESFMADTRDIYVDSNGNGERDQEDTYGYTTQVEQTGFLTSCNANVLSHTEDGGYEITLLSDKTVKLVEWVYDFYYESVGTYTGSWRSNYDNYYIPVFTNGHAAYAYSSLSAASGIFRDSEIVYGIVPMPKFDESQQEYHTFISTNLYSIPITCQNTELSGFGFEVMTYYGFYNILPTYYEITLKGKAADSPDDVDMLTIINNTLEISFAYCYDNWQGFAHLFGMRLNFTPEGGNRDLVSVYEKNYKPVSRRLQMVLKGFQD